MDTIERILAEFDCNSLTFFVNGQRVDVAPVDPRTTLAMFLRENLRLRGTKIGCNEGGCGACTVMISDVELSSGKIRHYSVNSCLTPVCSVFGKAVTTVEGISGGYKRLHPVQERLARAHGSQCGYCTPGFVMAMYTLLRNRPMPTMAEVDECVQGNLCRCTGYRPILEAFYSFTRQPTIDVNKTTTTETETTAPTKECTIISEKEAPQQRKGDAANGVGCCGGRGMGGMMNYCFCKMRIEPIEEEGAAVENGGGTREEKNNTKLPSKLVNGFADMQPLDATQELIFPPELLAGNWHRKSFAMHWNGFLWLQPTSLAHLLVLKRQMPGARLMAGNTEIGVELKFRHIELRTVLSVKQIPELRKHWLDADGVWFGSGMSLNEIKLLLDVLIAEQPEEKIGVLKAVREMLHLFAGQHVRNMATVAGNIATASPISDLNPIWMAANAKVLLESERQGKRQVELNPAFFPAYRKTGIAPEELLSALHIPFTNARRVFRAYKQAQRREDDIAIVTGAFLVEFHEEEQQQANGCCVDGGGIEAGEHIVASTAHLPSKIARLRIAFGGVGPTTRLAISTKCAEGMEWNDRVFELVKNGLAEEFQFADDVPGGMAKYRQALVLSFFMKFYLFVREQLEQPRELNDQQQEGALTTSPNLRLHLSELDSSSNSAFHSTQIYQDVARTQNPIDPVGRPLMHASGEKHTTGEAVYTTDIALPADCLHLAYVQAPVACGTLTSLDFSAALTMPGVVGAIDWRDVPGMLLITHHWDVPIFVKDKISYHGQPLAAICATDHETARRAAALVRVSVEREEAKAIVTIEEAIDQRNFLFPAPLRIHSSLALPEAKERVPIDWAKYKRVVQGQIRIGGQEHFYLETQNCVAIPGERDEMHIVASTQAVNDVQGDVCNALGVQRNAVAVSVRRIGGGFGGKESCCGLFAAAAAIAAKKFNRPVRFWLERFDDMAITGNRHPFSFDYQFALDDDGKFAAMEVNAYNNCGYSLDLSRGVMERAMAHIDNTYKFANLDVYGHMCRTNLASNTAFRGFGGPQGMFATETMVTHAAEEFGLEVDELRERNLYTEGDYTHYGMHLRQCNIRRCWTECRQWSDYEARKMGVQQWNARNRYIKRGIHLVPTKFGIAFGLKRLNQAGALVHVYTDGSVLISHGGMEMGQGLHTKMLQIAARCLGIDISLIRILDTATDKVPNASPTAASVGSDVNGLAVQNACETIMERLRPLRDQLPNKEAGWKELIALAYDQRIQLSATGFGRIHCDPVNFADGRGSEYYSYCVYGVGCAEVEVDCLTGDHRVLRVDIVMDIGESLNPAVDIGQIEGAFVQGHGLFTMEELKIRPDGTRLTRGPGTYKIPSADDAPRQFHVKLLAGSSNQSGIFSSKAVGEPPLFLGSCAFFAIRQAIRAYRVQNGIGNGGYFRLDSPATPERIRLACADALTENISSLPAAQQWTVDI